MSNSGTTHSGTREGGVTSFADLSLTKWVDKSSPILMLQCAQGSHIPTATLTVRKAGNNPLEYIKIELQDILVTSVSTGGSGGEDRLTENVTLNFRKIKVIYTEQDDTGKPAGQTEFSWDIATNTSP